MSCGCKNKKNDPNNGVDNLISESNTLTSRLSKNKIFIYTSKIFIFILSIPIVFLILPYVFWILFRSVVLDKDNNVINDLTKIIPRRKSKKDDEVEDEDEDENDEDDEYGQDYDDITEGLVDVELLDSSKKNLKNN